MFTSTTSCTGPPERVDEALDLVRERVLPAVVALPGAVGLSVLADRTSGRCIATSSWRTREELRAAEPDVAPLRAQAAAVLGGTPEVEEWEVALMHRQHPTPEGSWCRVTWARPPQVDRVVEAYRVALLPRIEAAPGFCSFSMLLDRAGGRVCETTTFGSREALEESRERAAALRDLAVGLASTSFTAVAELELVLAHLRLPGFV